MKSWIKWVILAVLIAAGIDAAWVFWPAPEGLTLAVTVRNTTSQPTSSLAIIGPSSRAFIGVVPPGGTRRVRLRDSDYGDALMLVGTTEHGLLDAEKDLGYSGMSAQLRVTWTDGSEIASAWATTDRVRYRYTRFWPGTLDGGGVWPLRPTTE